MPNTNRMTTAPSATAPSTSSKDTAAQQQSARPPSGLPEPDQRLHQQLQRGEEIAKRLVLLLLALLSLGTIAAEQLERCIEELIRLCHQLFGAFGR